MKGFDNFINILSENHMLTSGFLQNQPKPDALMDRLAEVLSDKLLMEIDELLVNFIYDLEEYSVSEGMKAAIEIIDEKYKLEG